MPTTAIFLGLDVSRHGLGAVLLGGDGKCIVSLRRGYGADADPDVPTDPQDWWRAARAATKDVLRKANIPASQIRAVGISGDEGFVPIDRNGNALGGCVLGADPSTAEALAELAAKVGSRTLTNLTGAPATTASGVVKLLTLRQREKRGWHDLHQVLPAKDWLRFRMTGTIGTDASDAVTTQLFNPRTRSWSKQLLTTLELPPEFLPPIAPGNVIAGRVTETAARESGLAAGTPVIVGGSHGAAITIASGGCTAGTAVIELGGRGSLFITTTETIKDPANSLTSTCHTIPGIGGLTGDVAGAQAVDWLLDTMLTSETAQARRAGRDPLDLFAELAAEIHPCADGLLCLTSREGRSALVGMDRRHHSGHVARADLEGGALACRRILAHHPGVKIVLTGPGAASILWSQIFCDVLNTQIHVIPWAEPAAIGSALLAASAVGVHKGLADSCARISKHHTTLSPRKSAADSYALLAPKADAAMALFNPPLPET